MNGYHNFLRNGKYVDSGIWLSRLHKLRLKCLPKGTATENKTVCASENHKGSRSGNTWDFRRHEWRIS